MRKRLTPPYCRHSIMKSLNCRVRKIHGFRIIESQKSAAVKLTALALLVLNIFKVYKVSVHIWGVLLYMG